MSNVMLPYYGEIEVTGMSFCEGCKETELQIDESKLFSESVCIERTIAIQCRHLKKCTHLREAINRSEKE